CGALPPALGHGRRRGLLQLAVFVFHPGGHAPGGIVGDHGPVEPAGLVVHFLGNAAAAVVGNALAVGGAVAEGLLALLYPGIVVVGPCPGGRALGVEALAHQGAVLVVFQPSAALQAVGEAAFLEGLAVVVPAFPGAVLHVVLPGGQVALVAVGQPSLPGAVHPAGLVGALVLGLAVLVPAVP